MFFNPVTSIRFIATHTIVALVGLIAIEAGYLSAREVKPAPPHVGTTDVVGGLPVGTALPHWTVLDVVQSMDAHKTLPGRVLKARRIVIADERIVITEEGVTVDRQRFDYGDDLALRALTAWLADSEPPVCQEECDNIGTIYIGSASGAGADLQIDGVSYFRLITWGGLTGELDGPWRELEYWMFMRWLHVARAGDPRFAQAIAEHDVLGILYQ